MAVKSIIDVDIDSAGNLQKFTALFEKYQKQLAKSPEAWAKMSKGSREALQAVQGISAAMMAQNRIFHDMDEDQRKRAGALKNTEAMWSRMASNAKSFAGSVFSAGKEILKWGGLLGGGLLGGSLWGLTRMASNVSDQRRSGMGLGMSIGEQKSFGINFGRLVDPGSYLSWMNSIETDPTKAWSAYALGVNPTGNTEADAVSMLKALRAKAQSTPTNQLGLLTGQYGLSGVSEEDLRRLKTMSGKEFGSLVAGNARDVNALNISDPIARKWQDFTNQLERAGSEIFKTFVIGLAPLADPLTHLSGAFAKFLETMLKSDLVKNAITDLSGWLENFSGKLSAPEFLKSVDTFLADVGLMAQALHAVTHPGEIVAKAKTFLSPTSQDLKDRPGFVPRYIDRINGLAGLPVGFLQTVAGLEHSGINATSPKGAMGIFQLMPGTAKQYGAANPFDPIQNIDAASRYATHLQEHYRGNVAEMLAAYNWGEGNLDKDLKAHPKDWQTYLPRETRQYLLNASPFLKANGGAAITVTINNNTGGSTVATVSGLAP